MSEWTNQIEQHQLNDLLRSAAAAVETSLAQEVERDPDTTERLARIAQVIAEVTSRLAAIDTNLVPLQALNNLTQPVQRINDSLASYQASSDSSHVATAHNQVENVLVHLNAIPVPCSATDIDGIREATTGLRRSVGQNIRYLDAQTASAREVLERLEQQLVAVEAKLAESQERLDARVEETDRRLIAAEAQRSSTFETAQAERERRAQELHDLTSTEWTSLLEKQSSEFAALLDQGRAEMEQAKADAQVAGQQVLETMEELKAEAQNLVGIITDTGMIGGYQKEANTAQRAGTIWRVIAALSLAGLVVFAVYVFATHVDRASQTSWADVGWRVFVASAVGLFAAYAARQADKHDRTRRRSRRMELELASISPYLYALPEEQQIEMKMDLARRLFGQVEIHDSKDDTLTTGTQADVIKMLVENLQTFINRS